MKTDSYQTKRRNIILRKTMKRKVEEKQIEELLELFLSLPNDTQHYWEKEANETKEKKV